MPLAATGQELLEALEPEEHKGEFRVLTCLTFGTHPCFLFHLPPAPSVMEMTKEGCVQVALARLASEPQLPCANHIRGGLERIMRKDPTHMPVFGTPGSVPWIIRI